MNLRFFSGKSKAHNSICLCAYDVTKTFIFVEDPGPEDTRTDVTLAPDPIPILIPIGDVLEADRTRQNIVVEGAGVTLQCPTEEGTQAAGYVMFKADC